MSTNEKVRMWKRGENIEPYGASKNGMRSAVNVKGLSASLVTLFDQMVSDVLISMDTAHQDLQNRVERICSTEELCVVCRAKQLGDSCYAQCAGGRALEECTDKKQ